VFRHHTNEIAQPVTNIAAMFPAAMNLTFIAVKRTIRKARPNSEG
jgi:hypothetical protein